MPIYDSHGTEHSICMELSGIVNIGIGIELPYGFGTRVGIGVELL